MLCLVSRTGCGLPCEDGQFSLATDEPQATYNPRALPESDGTRLVQTFIVLPGLTVLSRASIIYIYIHIHVKHKDIYIYISQIFGTPRSRLRDPPQTRNN